MGVWRIPSNSGGNFVVVVGFFVVVVFLVALVDNFDELIVVLIKFNFEVWRDLYNKPVILVKILQTVNSIQS